ncbi:LysR family transcriptional regulator [Bacillus cereus]|uniref:LysR family transcriptional regulator n=1 Tax=Bacillus cereus TaxID=1396 RepID=UPI001CBBFC6D|nr:LysR family transcriptional regulator [Bacillus cereus]
MEFYQLEYFQVIAEERSFSKASEVLHISQPALSRQIKALEEELKQQLFIRNGKSLTLMNKITSKFALLPQLVNVSYLNSPKI